MLRIIISLLIILLESQMQTNGKAIKKFWAVWCFSNCISNNRPIWLQSYLQILYGCQQSSFCINYPLLKAVSCIHILSFAKIFKTKFFLKIIQFSFFPGILVWKKKRHFKFDAISNHILLFRQNAENCFPHRSGNEARKHVFVQTVLSYQLGYPTLK